METKEAKEKRENEEKRNYLQLAKEGFKLEQNQVKKIIENQQGITERYHSGNIPEKSALYFKGNSSCHYTIDDDTRVVKILVEGCKECHLTLGGGILTGVVEIWDCTSITVHVKTTVSTMQLDISEDLNIHYESTEHLGSLVQAGVKGLRINFKDAEHYSFESGLEVLKKEHPDLDDTTDQFITRFVEGQILTERIVRLANGFPTTERERLIYAERAEKNGQVMEEAVRQMMTSSVSQVLDPKDKRAIESLAAKTEKKPAVDETSIEAKVAYKRNEGNEAFQEENFQQAAVFYTEALALQPSAVCFSNRSACWLKLGHHEKALEDAEECLKLDPLSIKGHFRKGLSLHALGRYSEAVGSLQKASDLDPKNKQIRAALQLSEFKARTAAAAS